MPIYRTQSITPMLPAVNPLDRSGPREELSLLLREAGIPVPEGSSYSEPRGGDTIGCVRAFAQYVKDGLASDHRHSTLVDVVRGLLLSPGTTREVFLGAVAVYRAGLLRELVLDTQSPYPTETWTHVLARHGTAFGDFTNERGAATINLVERFIALHDAGFSFHAGSVDLPSAISVAVRTDNPDTVRALMGAGASMIGDLDGWTPLHEAAFCGSAAVLSYLLAEDWIDVNAQGPAQATALHLAARNGHEPALRVLLGVPGVDLEAQRGDGATAIWLAAKYGASKAMGLLLDKGAKAKPLVALEEPLPGSFEPLHVAAMAGHAEVVELLSSRADVDVNAMTGATGHTALHLAAYAGHTEVVRALLDVPSIEVNVKNDAGDDVFCDDDTPLHLAVKKGHGDVVRLILAAPGVDVNASNALGETPLFQAAEKGNLEVMMSLLSVTGINVDARSHDGDETPLFAALSLGNFEAVDALVKSGAALTQVYGQSNALHCARDADVAELLLDLGGEGLLVGRDELGQTPLHKAVISSRWGVVGVLGRYPERWAAVLDGVGMLAIEYALRPAPGNPNRLKDAELLNVLIPAPIDTCNRMRETSLHLACERPDFPGLAGKLLGLGANVNAQTILGRTPLHYAVQSGDIRLVSTLLGAGADVNAVNMLHNSPLHDAVLAGRHDIVVALLDGGNAQHVAGARGMTPYHLAVEGGHTAIAATLRLAFPGSPRQRTH